MMKPLRTQKEVLEEWAGELSVHLGRPVAELLQRGLSAYDFGLDQTVEVRGPDGMRFVLPFAFALIRKASGEVAVFTEHSGYVEFLLEEEATVTRITEDVYYHAP